MKTTVRWFFRLSACSAACAAAGLGLLAGVLSGCTPSPWQQNYKGSIEGPSTPGSRVVVRTVPWERLQSALDEMRSEVAASDVHPDEWDAAKKLEHKARLLRGLQVSGAPDAVHVLGMSEFRTTHSVRPETDEGAQQLADTARKVGADMVVWSSRSLGKTDVVTDHPVSSWSTGSDYYRDPNDANRRRSTSYTEHTTTWIPVRVTRDEYGFVAYFLRGAAK